MKKIPSNITHNRLVILLKMFVFVLLLLAGCSTAKIDEATTPLAASTPTPQPTAQPTPTITPTLAYPVLLSTPFTDGLKVITADNILDIGLLAYSSSPQVRLFSVSPNAELGFVATTNGVIVYDIASKQVVKQLPPISSSGIVDSLSISSNGSRFAILADYEAQVWDLSDGLIFSLPLSPNGYNESYIRVKLSPDGKTLAVRDCDDSTEYGNQCWPVKIVLYNVESGAELDPQPEMSDQYYFNFSPDVSYFVAWSGVATFWSTSDWSIIGNLQIARGQTIGGLSPNGKLIALQDDQKVLIYQVENLKLIRQISVAVDNADEVAKIVFSPDETLIGITGNDEITVWNIITGEKFGSFPKTVISWGLSNDGQISTWSIPEEIFESQGLVSNQYRSVFSYSKTKDAFIEVQTGWDTLDGESVNTYKTCTYPLGDGTICQDYSVPVWTDSEGNLYKLHDSQESGVFDVIRVLPENTENLGTISSAAIPIWISNDNRFVLADSNDKTEIWDIISGTQVISWDGYTASYVVSLDEKTLAIALQKICGYRQCLSNFVVYDLENNITLKKESYDANAVATALSFTNDGQLIYSVCNYNTGVQAFQLDPKTGQKEKIDFSFPEEAYYDSMRMTISPDGELLALGLPDGTIHLYDAETFQELQSWQAHSRMITNLDFNPDGTLLTSASILWDMGDGFLRTWGIVP